MTDAPHIGFKEINARLDGMFIDLHKQYSASIPKDLAVPMVLTEQMREAIAQDYTYNLNIDISRIGLLMI